MMIDALSRCLAAQQVSPTRRLVSTRQTSDTAAVQDGSSGISQLGSDMQQLQKLLGSNPDQFKTVTSTISQKLDDAAQTAATSGDTQQAGALNDLAAKFKTASETGTMPHLHHGHHAHRTADTARSSTSSASSPSNTDLADAIANLLKQYTQNAGTDPMSTLTGIMNNVLGSATTSS